MSGRSTALVGAAVSDGVPSSGLDGDTEPTPAAPVRVYLIRRSELVRSGGNEYELDEYADRNYVVVEVGGESFSRSYHNDRAQRAEAVSVADRVAALLGVPVTDYGGVA